MIRAVERRLLRAAVLLLALRCEPARGQWGEANQFFVSLGCQLFKVGCPEKRRVTVDAGSIETRLSFHCADATEADLLQDYGSCWDKLRKPAVVLGRSERVAGGNPYLGGKGAYPWVGNIVWGGPSAVFQTFQETQLVERYGYWRARDFPTWSCAEAGSAVCRRQAVCSMTEEVFGRLLDFNTQYGDPNHMYELKWEDWLELRTADGLAVDLPMQMTERCILCQTVPCEPFWCTNGKVTGAPVRTEPAYLGRVMERQPCERSCVAGTFLTCAREREGCWYRPATDREVAGGDAGLREWWGYNAYTNRSDANLVPVGTAGPPVAECYPCLYADRRTHFGVSAGTERSVLQRGFLDFHCPGGALGPEDCPLNQVSRVDPATNRSTSCGCMAGYYWSEEEKRCALCPAGHFCAWEGSAPPVVRECPNDHYATGGAEACRRCNMGRQCDGGQALTRCLQNGASGESGKYQREDAQCVLCAECVQLGAGRDGVPCYKVSSLVAV